MLKILKSLMVISSFVNKGTLARLVIPRGIGERKITSKRRIPSLSKKNLEENITKLSLTSIQKCFLKIKKLSATIVIKKVIQHQIFQKRRKTSQRRKCSIEIRKKKYISSIYQVAMMNLYLLIHNWKII